MSHKYIKVSGVGFIVWPRTDLISHVSISRAARGGVISAGFCNIFTNENTGKVEASCFGRSESLDLDSEEEDSELLTMQLNGMDFDV